MATLAEELLNLINIDKINLNSSNKFIYKTQTMEEQLEESYNSQLKLFVETNVKLTEYYIKQIEKHITRLRYILEQLRINNFKPKDNTNIFPLKMDDDCPQTIMTINKNRQIKGEYYPEHKYILLPILDNNFHIIFNDESIINAFKHELIHYYDDLAQNGRGLVSRDTSNLTKDMYYNNKLEFNAFLKTLISHMEDNMMYSIQTIRTQHPELLFQDAINKIFIFSINAAMINDTSLIGFVQNLNNKNKHKLFKEIYGYFKSYFQKHRQEIEEIYSNLTKENIMRMGTNMSCEKNAFWLNKKHN